MTKNIGDNLNLDLATKNECQKVMFRQPLGIIICAISLATLHISNTITSLKKKSWNL